MRRHVLASRGGALTAWLAVLLLAATVQAQTEAPVGVQLTQQQWQQDVPEPVQPPTVHLRQPGFSPPPAPAHAASHFAADADATTDPLLPNKRHKSPQQHMPPQHAPRGPRPRVPLSAVVTMSAFMALMSTLGVLPYFFFSKLSRPWAGLANAVASGVMLAASFGLLAEGAPYSGTYLIGGMLLGVLFVKFSQEHLEQYEVDSFEQLAGADARKVILFLAVMAVHAVGEGGGVGVSFAGDRGWAQGTLVTLAIGLHNVPEGLAVATVMAAKGTPPGRTLLWTALTALPQAILAPIAYVFVDTFKALLPLALGFAAGCMIWIVLAELLPDALEAVEAEQVATYATAAAAWLQGLSVFIAQLETPAGTLSSPFGDYAEGWVAGAGAGLGAAGKSSCEETGGAAGSGGALGLQLAGALAAAPDHIGHVLPPVVLLGTVFGAACVGLLQPLLGHRMRLIGAAASLICSMPVLVAVLALLFQPAWVQEGSAFAAADSVQGLTIGFNLFVLLVLVLPMGKRWGPKKCSVGVACGVGCGVLLSGLLGLLCMASPYCLHVRPAGFLAGSVA
ncbi:hypothetical protein OEZ85_014156 [Tetradesmus obliquus]|uniref:Uncharacterized protein n=1 Tax=Tetradesmus obliquus TaxID=3088 RepID=A0ABY8U9F9_TETOB|nr:hypothetical protein OEZ85_014156 [Tetradesmus obliquus]